MRGSIVKKGNKWYIVVDERDERNKRKRKWISGFNTEKEAEKALPQILLDLQNGQLIDNTNITVREFLERFLEKKKGKVTASTYDRYRLAINRGIDILGPDKRVQKVKPADIQRLSDELSAQLSPNGALSYYRVINTAFRTALGEILKSNPFDSESVMAPRAQKTKMKTWSEEHIKIFLNAVRGHVMYLVTVLAVTCGLRRGEILGLQWEDVDFINKRLNIVNSLVHVNNELILQDTKTSGSRRSVALPTIAIEALKEQKSRQDFYRSKLGEGNYIESDYVCTWEDGRPIPPKYVNKKMSRIYKKLDIPKIRFHDLRHTHATLLLKSNVNIKVIQERLGHSRVSITLDTYSHLTDDMQKEAADTMDSLF